MNTMNEIVRQLQAGQNFVLVGHAVPDGDCIGSLLAACTALRQMGKTVDMLLEDQVPQIYSYLALAAEIKRPFQLDMEPDTIIFLDCSDMERVGEKTLAWLKEKKAALVNIDHHATNDMFGDFNYVEPEAAATAEILFHIIAQLPVEMNTNIADCLFAGIVMDTGQFLNSNTTSATLRTTATLLDLGSSVDRARTHLFESKPREEVLLLRQALQHLNFNRDGRIAWMLLPHEEIEAVGAGNIHPEGIINYARMIAGVEVALLFREITPGVVKVGFRSRGDIDVARIAAEFGGGGHKRASGARLEGSLEEATGIILRKVEEVLNHCTDS